MNKRFVAIWFRHLKTDWMIRQQPELHCENWSGLFRGLTAANNENISILARSPRDENDGFPLPSQSRVTQKRKKVIQEELFPDARNFR
jgi:hypothetical protein